MEAEHGRFNRINQKATTYLSVISLLFGIASVFGQALIKGFIPPKSLLEWIILNLGVLIFISLSATWCIIFRAYKFEGLLTPPLKELVDFYHKNELIDIYFAMSKAYANATNENIKVTNRKALLLDQGHKMIILTACLSMVFAILYFAQLWSLPPAQVSSQLVQQTVSNQNSHKQSDQAHVLTNSILTQSSLSQTTNSPALNQNPAGGNSTNTNSP